MAERIFVPKCVWDGVRTEDRASVLATRIRLIDQRRLSSVSKLSVRMYKDFSYYPHRFGCHGISWSKLATWWRLSACESQCHRDSCATGVVTCLHQESATPLRSPRRSFKFSLPLGFTNYTYISVALCPYRGRKVCRR